MQARFGRIPRRWVAAAIALAGALVLLASWLGGLAALVVALVAIALVLVGLALWRFPPRQADRAGDITPKERVELENELRKTIAEAVGGLIVIAGLAFTWLQLDATRDEQRLAREQQQTAAAQAATGQADTRAQVQMAAGQATTEQALTREGQQITSTQAAADRELEREGQLTERFTAAVGQLGDDRLQVRLGGIYALERIARDSKDDAAAVMQILTAFVRETAPRTPDDGSATPVPHGDGPPEDVQAVLSVIERGRWAERWATGGPFPLPCLDLSSTDLRWATLRGSDRIRLCLEGAYLSGADLVGATLAGADLSHADLSSADLTGVVGLTKAQVEGAIIDENRRPYLWPSDQPSASPVP
jgi:hypothetical protein